MYDKIHYKLKKKKKRLFKKKKSKHHVSQALYLVRRVLFINRSSGPVTLESVTLPWLFSMQHNENHYKL